MQGRGGVRVQQGQEKWGGESLGLSQGVVASFGFRNLYILPEHLEIFNVLPAPGSRSVQSEVSHTFQLSNQKSPHTHTHTL